MRTCKGSTKKHAPLRCPAEAHAGRAAAQVRYEAHGGAHQRVPCVNTALQAAVAGRHLGHRDVCNADVTGAGLRVCACGGLQCADTPAQIVCADAGRALRLQGSEQLLLQQLLCTIPELNDNEKSLDEMRRIFQHYDDDGSGELDEEEFVKAG